MDEEVKQTEGTEQEMQNTEITEENNVEELHPEIEETNEMDKLAAELEESKKSYLYLRAEFENYRKKMIKERSDWVKYGSENVLRELLGIIDNFDLALQTEVTADNLNSFTQGVNMIRSEITSSLERAGLQEVDPKGEKFNPNLHEALTMEESSEVEDGHVLRVFKKAYKLHDKLLRPAQVVVAQKPKEKTED
ncbi:MAG: nucleotide exchange factor GrpE [Bdellovibrionales bacterium]